MPKFAPLAKAFVLQKKVALAPHVLGHIYRVCYIFCEKPLDANQGGHSGFFSFGFSPILLSYNPNALNFLSQTLLLMV